LRNADEGFAEIDVSRELAGLQINYINVVAVGAGFADTELP